MIKLVDILKELFEIGLGERTKAPTTIIRNKVLDHLKSKGYDVRPAKATNRIFASQLANKPEEVKAALKDLTDIKLTNDPPIKPPSSISSKFYAYTVSDGSQEYNIVIGAGIQGGEAHEKREIGSLQDQLKKAIADAGGSIKIKIGSLDAYEIKKGNVTKVAGQPMADLVIDDVIFIQLKDLRFQQLSGVIKVSKYGSITDEGRGEIKSFVKSVGDLTGGKMSPKQNYRRLVSDPTLAKLAIFGDPSTPFGIDHVQLVCKGTLHLEKIEGENLYTIKGSSDGNTKAVTDTLESSDKWWPYLYAKYSIKHNQMGIESCRFNFGTADFIPNATKI